MKVNTTIYGAPETWTTAQYLTFAKYANFDTAENPKNTLIDGNNQGKTPTGELVENSICTQALGAESLYSNIVWVHDYGGGQQYVVDEKPQVPYFFAECVSADGNVQNTESHINPIHNYNSWMPYITDESYQNKSAYSKPIVEYNPNKILYILNMTVCNENGVERTVPYSMHSNDVDDSVWSDYPYVVNAYLVPYVDTSNTSTPNRELINSNALFGVCPNININADTSNINIDYAFFRSCQYNAIPIYGCFGINYFDDHYTACLCDPADIIIEDNHVTTRHLWSAKFKEFLIRQAACFGVYIRIGVEQLEPYIGVGVLPLDSNDVICGILDENGVGHGEYTRGIANRTNPIWDWETNRDSPFDPYKIPDPTRYDTTTVFNTVSVYNTFIKYFALNDAQLQRLCTNIYTYINSIDTNVEDITKAISKTFYTNNPLDVIVSLKKFPFNIGAYMRGQGQLENIKLGHLDSGTQGYKIAGTYTVVDLGSYPCYEYFGGTFLDYMPYTYYDLIVPFCGSIRLDPAQFMGHTLRLKMAIDIYTGACTCYILSDNLCIDTISGNCAVDIPVTGIQSADFQNSMQNAITNVKNARLNSAAFNMRGNLAIGVALTGEVGGNALMKSKPFTAVGNAMSSAFGNSLWSTVNIPGNLANSEKETAQNAINVNKAEYDLQHLETPFAMVGSQSAANSFTEETNARLIIYRPQFADDYDPAIYADCFGFATLENDTLNKYSGFTVAKINLNGVRCSEEEKTIIESMFSQGVYL